MNNYLPLYVDYAGGKFEAWFYKNGNRKFVADYLPFYSDVKKYFKASPFNKLVLTSEAEMFKSIKP